MHRSREFWNNEKWQRVFWGDLFRNVYGRNFQYAYYYHPDSTQDRVLKIDADITTVSHGTVPFQLKFTTSQQHGEYAPYINLTTAQFDRYERQRSDFQAFAFAYIPVAPGETIPKYGVDGHGIVVSKRAMLEFWRAEIDRRGTATAVYQPFAFSLIANGIPSANYKQFKVY